MQSFEVLRGLGNIKNDNNKINNIKQYIRNNNTILQRYNLLLPTEWNLEINEQTIKYNDMNIKNSERLCFIQQIKQNVQLIQSKAKPIKIEF